MAGYSKVFSSLWGGSLYGRFEASAVFMVMLSLCDHDGVVDMTPEAVAGTTGWPLSFIMAGLAELIAPDPRSRTPTHEGRRLLPLDEHRSWGWRITNYVEYRNKMRSLERREYLAEAKRRERAAKASTHVNTSTTVNHGQPTTEAYSEAEALIPVAGATVGKAQGLPACPYEQIVQIYHEELPTLPRVARLTVARKAQIKARWNEDNQDLDGWRTFFKYIGQSDFLMGRSKARKDSATPFQADLEWITKAANWIKIVEGKYHHE